MQAHSSGAIIVTGMGAAGRPFPMFPAYNAAKAALRNLVLNMAVEVEPLGVHMAIVTVTGFVQPETTYPDEIAEQYWALYTQAPGHWEREVVSAPASGTSAAGTGTWAALRKE